MHLLDMHALRVRRCFIVALLIDVVRLLSRQSVCVRFVRRLN